MWSMAVCSLNSKYSWINLRVNLFSKLLFYPSCHLVMISNACCMRVTPCYLLWLQNLGKRTFTAVIEAFSIMRWHPKHYKQLEAIVDSTVRYCSLHSAKALNFNTWSVYQHSPVHVHCNVSFLRNVNLFYLKRKGGKDNNVKSLPFRGLLTGLRYNTVYAMESHTKGADFARLPGLSFCGNIVVFLCCLSLTWQRKV